MVTLLLLMTMTMMIVAGDYYDHHQQYEMNVMLLLHLNDDEEIHVIISWMMIMIMQWWYLLLLRNEQQQRCHNDEDEHAYFPFLLCYVNSIYYLLLHLLNLRLMGWWMGATCVHFIYPLADDVWWWWWLMYRQKEELMLAIVATVMSCGCFVCEVASSADRVVDRHHTTRRFSIDSIDSNFSHSPQTNIISHQGKQNIQPTTWLVS